MQPEISSQEAETKALIQDVLSQVLHYKPRNPLAFIVQYLDELCGESTPQVSAFYRLLLTRDDPDLFVDEVQRSYGAFASRRSSESATGEDVERLTRCFCMEMPVRYEKVLVEAVTELVAPEEACDFETFCACVRIGASCYGIFRDAYELWFGLGDPSLLVEEAARSDSPELRIPQTPFDIEDLVSPLQPRDPPEDEPHQPSSSLARLLQPVTLLSTIQRFADKEQLGFEAVVEAVIHEAPARLLELHAALLKLGVKAPPVSRAAAAAAADAAGASVQANPTEEHSQN